ncbi:MAG: glycosyltransferase, partial [Phycisphaeraceae bacterium]|nr:glycosyltransferase [Phycisphaeraceae bacterium]
MIDVLIITKNEEANIGSCLEALEGWTQRIFVVDSGSTDRTREIVESTDATFIHHDWSGYAAQKNWALNNLP